MMDFNKIMDKAINTCDSNKSDIQSVISQLEKAISLINQKPSEAAYEIANARASLVKIANNM